MNNSENLLYIFQYTEPLKETGDVDELLEKEELQKIKDIIKITKNTDYIKWLRDFTNNKYKHFITNFANFYNDELNDYDLENINKLSLFFSSIHIYALTNNIDFYPDNFNDCYRVVFYDYMFEIGTKKNDTDPVYIAEFHTTNEDYIKYYIDYRDVMKFYLKEKQKIYKK